MAARAAQGPLADNFTPDVDAAVSRLSAGGLEPAVIEQLLTASWQGEVAGAIDGTVLPTGATALRATGPLAATWLRIGHFAALLRQGIGAATAARQLVVAADGRAIVDSASAELPFGEQAAFMAYCGRVGGFSGTTTFWGRSPCSVPFAQAPAHDAILAVPDNPDPPPSADVVLDGDDLHASVAALARRVSASGVLLQRVQLDRPLDNDVETERHFLLRRALDRHQLRRVRICAVVPPNVAAIRRLTATKVPVDQIVLHHPWWTPMDVSLERAARPLPVREDQTLLVTIVGAGRPLSLEPQMIRPSHPLAQPWGA